MYVLSLMLLVSLFVLRVVCSCVCACVCGLCPRGYVDMCFVFVVFVSCLQSSLLKRSSPCYLVALVPRLRYDDDNDYDDDVRLHLCLRVFCFAYVMFVLVVDKNMVIVVNVARWMCVVA